MDKLFEICGSISDFCYRYVWNILPFLLGALIVMVVWFFKHPEDFYSITIV